MKKSVSQQLVEYLKNSGRASSGELQRLNWFNANETLAVPRSVVRRLEELAEDGILKVSYEKNHAFYEYNHDKKEPPKHVFMYDEKRGVVIEDVI